MTNRAFKKTSFPQRRLPFLVQVFVVSRSHCVPGPACFVLVLGSGNHCSLVGMGSLCTSPCSSPRTSLSSESDLPGEVNIWNEILRLAYQYETGEISRGFWA